MATTQKILFGSVLLACAQFSFAQSAADTIEVPPPASVTTPYMSEGVSGQPGASVSPETSGASSASGEPRIETVTVISGPFAVGSTDPYVQRREALAQARDEYRARQEAARQEYREDRREANTEFRSAR